ncbi:MAG: hypothetical protein IAE91_10430 [Ignavibacteriaceae bacterium]|nr:hypothetical protein [Ignavibacteriaceae bacterium]
MAEFENGKNDLLQFFNEFESKVSLELKHRDTVKSLLFYCIEENMAEDFTLLVFNAKYIRGLANAYRKAIENPEARSAALNISNDIMTNVSKFLELLKSILEETSEDFQLSFVEKFFPANDPEYSTLMELIFSLSEVKEHLNDSKRS